MKNKFNSDIHKKFPEEQDEEKDLTNKSLSNDFKIFRINKKGNEQKGSLESHYWDIKQGDYIPDPSVRPRKHRRKLKKRIDFGLLLIFCVVAVLMAILISSWLAEKI